MRPTLPAARGSSQLAAIAESLVTDAESSNRRVTCLLQIISDGTRVRHAQGITLSILRAFIACAATAVQTAVLVLFGPSCVTVERVCVFKNYVYVGRQRYTVIWPYTVCRRDTKTKISRTRTHTWTDFLGGDVPGIN